MYTLLVKLGHSLLKHNFILEREKWEGGWGLFILLLVNWYLCCSSRIILYRLAYNTWFVQSSLFGRSKYITRQSPIGLRPWTQNEKAVPSVFSSSPERSLSAEKVDQLSPPTANIPTSVLPQTQVSREFFLEPNHSSLDFLFSKICYFTSSLIFLLRTCNVFMFIPVYLWLACYGLYRNLYLCTQDV